MAIEPPSSYQFLADIIKCIFKKCDKTFWVIYQSDSLEEVSRFYKKFIENFAH